jgi:cell wall assembly regulator SMI1
VAVVPCPGGCGVTAPGISDGQLAQAEEKLGFALPPELVQFLQVHDGSGGLWLHDRGEFMSLEGVLSAWDREVDLWGDGDNDDYSKPSGPIKRKWFTQGWVPVLDERTGSLVCIDLDPPPDGKMGQLIEWRHDRGPGEVLAPGLRDLLESFVHDLDAGLYTPRQDQAGQMYLEFN